MPHLEIARSLGTASPILKIRHTQPNQRSQILLDLHASYRYQATAATNGDGMVSMFTLNRLLLGQYKPADTPIHRLDPRVKLIWALVMMAILALTLDAVVYIGMTVYLIILIVVSRLPKESLLPAVKSFIMLFAITFLLHILFAPPGGRVYFTVLGVEVSSHGVSNGFFYSYRILLFLMTATLANLTTSPVSMTNGIIELIKPLRYLRVPVGEVSVMVFVALRFIPILSEEARMIRAAQISRGLEPGRGFVSRFRSIIPFVLPLFLGALRRSEHLALAIESRGYRKGVMRTSLTVLRTGRVDLIFGATSIACISLFMILSGMVSL